MSAHDAIALHHDDDVATLLRDTVRGDTLRVRKGDSVTELTCVDDVPLCHKIALHPIPAGAPIRKYGEVIGEATSAIPPGAHVHIHNLRTLRGAAGNESDTA